MAGLPSGIVTFAFADIEGSTRLFARLGEAWPALLAQHHQLVLDAAARWGGVLVKTGGDSVLVAFPDAAGAVAAGVDAQEALHAHAWPEEGVIRSRIGLHTGPAEPSDGDYIALALHQAARVTDTGHGGQVVVSEITAVAASEHLPDDVILAPIGRYVVRDFAEPVPLFEARRRGDDRRSPALRAPEVLDRAVTTRRTNFVGRDEELALVGKALEHSRLVTVIGLSGVGKTRLVVEVAAERPGSYLVELAPVAAGAGVDAAVAAATGASTDPRADPLDAAIEALGKSGSLLVLDNCEHVLDAAARTVDRLLAAVPSLLVLATSQAPLGVPGEQLIRLGPLEVPATVDAPLDEVLTTEAGRLFSDRARAADAGFALRPDDGPTLARLCHALDGLPLAIELAAARAALLGLDVVAGQSDHPLALLGGGTRIGPERHRTLRAAIEWSHDLLEDATQAVLRGLAIFRGSFSVTDAEAVVGQGAFDGVVALAEGSLLARVPGDGPPRFRLLESVRAFALERLHQAGEWGASASRHLIWITDRVVAAPDTVELADLDAALSFASSQADTIGQGVALANALFERPSAYPLASLDRHAAAMAARPDLDPATRTSVLMLLAELSVKTGAAAGVERTEAAVASARASGTRLAEALSLAGSAHARTGRYDAALALLGEAAELAAAGGDQHLALRARLSEASARIEMGDHSIAAEALESVVAEMRRLGHRDIGRALNNWAIALERTSRFDESIAAHGEALRLRQASGDRAGEASTLINLSSVLTRAGRYAETAAALERALGLAVDDDLTGMLGIVIVNIAELGATQGAHTRAAVLYGAAARLYEEVGRPLNEGVPDGSEPFAALVRDAIGDAAFTAARAGGRLLSIDEIVAECRQLLQARPAADPPVVAPAPAAGSREATATFRREGEFWTVGFEGSTVRLKDSKGMAHLARLLAAPGAELHALDLAGAGSDQADRSDAGPVLDAAAKEAYRRQLSELAADLEEAEANHDPARAELAQREIDALTDQLAAAVGLGGRDRKAASSSERARIAATRTIRAAIDRIDDAHPTLGAHLRHAIRTGTYCVYDPDPRAPVRWEI